MNISRRRCLILIAAGVTTPRNLAAELLRGVPRLGVLAPGVVAQVPYWNGLWDGLRDLGCVDGRTIKSDVKESAGSLVSLPALARELVALRPDAIVAGSPPAVDAAKTATRTIPVIMLGVSSPLELGFIKGFPRPGGNVTGVTLLAQGLGAKRLQLLREVLPELSRVAVLWNPSNRGAVITFQETQRGAHSLGMTVISAPVTKADDVPRSLAATLSERPGALNVISGPVTVGQRERAAIVEFAVKHRLCSISSFPAEAADGGRRQSQRSTSAPQLQSSTRS